MRTRRYEFRVDGRLSEESRTAFVDMRITGRRQTIIDSEVLDESHLHGIIVQLRHWAPRQCPRIPFPQRPMPGSARAAAEKVVLVGGEHREPAAAHAELGVDRPYVALDGVHRHGEIEGDLIERQQ